MRHYGLMETIVGRLKALVGRSPRTSELAMFGVAWSLNFILLGSTGRISVIAGPINDELGAMQRIHPYRRANITDAVASTFSYFVPWHLWPIIMLSVIEPLAATYDFITIPAPSDFLLTTFYPAVIWVVMLIAVLTGWGGASREETASGSWPGSRIRYRRMPRLNRRTAGPALTERVQSRPCGMSSFCVDVENRVRHDRNARVTLFSLLPRRIQVSHTTIMVFDKNLV